MRRVLLIALIGALMIGCTGEALPVVFAPVEPLAPTIGEPMAGSETILATDEPIPAEPITEEMTMTQEPSTTSGEVAPEPSPEPTPEPTTTPAVIELPGTELFTFVAGELGWYVVDDNVMGGVSNSTVTFAEPNIMVFTGVMSLDNNGGFSSVQSDWRPMDLTGADGILLRVLGDGKSYRLRIRSTETGRNIAYNALFETTPETWTLVYVPFGEMVPTYFGSRANVGPLNPATIGSFGFMLSDKQPGEFGLQVDWMRAVSEEELRAMTG